MRRVVIDLAAWLAEHGETIAAFTDYEPVFCDRATLYQRLGAFWFRDPDWNEPGYRFASLGQDGTGGDVLLWGTDPGRVVFFGSEGGCGVLTETPLAFAQALAYAPRIVEYGPGSVDASLLSIEENWLAEDAPAAIAEYRRAVEARFGPLPPFNELIRVSDAAQAKFRGWVHEVYARANERDAREKALAEETARAARREKATRYAAHGAPDGKDGLRYDGVCAACGKATTLRLVRYEALAFGLCLPCYFDPERW